MILVWYAKYVATFHELLINNIKKKQIEIYLCLLVMIVIKKYSNPNSKWNAIVDLNLKYQNIFMKN